MRTTNERLLDLLRTGFGPVPSLDADLVGTGLLDSVGVMNLVLDLERAFGIRVHDADLRVENFRTARAIGALVDRRAQAVAA